mmetsp:Transcript_69898/g.202583  ORF Transcript_69898/g.202583 Transcript_69898/m.202583 type:complete len:429 (-) Transcript_69898:274-1560(-)
MPKHASLRRERGFFCPAHWHGMPGAAPHLHSTSRSGRHARQAFTSLPRGSQLHNGLERVVVAAAGAKVACSGDVRATAEDVIHSTEGRARHHGVHAHAHVLERLRVRPCIEIADEDDHVALMGLLRRQLQEVEGRGLAAAAAAGVQRQRAVVVDEEDDLARLPVLQAHPHARPGAVPLVRPILRHVLRAVGEQIPGLSPVGDAERVRPRDRAVGAREPGVAEHPAEAFALLEGHHVKRRVVRGLDQVPGAAAVAAAAAKEAPPKQVVGQHLHLDAVAVAAAPQPPAGLRLHRLAPLALRHDAPRRLVPEAFRGDRAVLGPRGLLIPLLRSLLRLGESARPRASRPRVCVQRRLKFFEGGLRGEPRVHLGGVGLPYALRHRIHDVAVAGLALLHCTALGQLLLGRLSGPPNGRARERVESSLGAHNGID